MFRAQRRQILLPLSRNPTLLVSMADVVSAKRRRACARELGFDEGADKYYSRALAKAVGGLLENMFAIRDPGAFLRDYAQRVDRGDEDDNYADLEVDIVTFHRILGYGVDLGWESEHYNEATARKEVKGLLSYEEVESDVEQDEDATEEQSPEEQANNSADDNNEEEGEESKEELADAEATADVDATKENSEDSEDSDAGGSSVSASSKSKQGSKRKNKGAANSRAKNREIADLVRWSMADSSRNQDYYRKNGGCPTEAQLGKRSHIRGDYAGSGSGGSGSGNNNGGGGNGRGTADLRESESVDTPMKMNIEDLQEYKATWVQYTQWLVQEVEKTGCLSPGQRDHIFIPFMASFAMGILDEHEQNCGLKALASFFPPPSHGPRSDHEHSVLQNTIIKTPVFRFLVNNVVEVSVYADKHF